MGSRRASSAPVKVPKSQFTVILSCCPYSTQFQEQAWQEKKAEKEAPLCHCKSEWWIHMVSKIKILVSSPFLSAKTRILNLMLKEINLNTRGPGSNSPLHHAHDSSRISQASFSLRGIKGAQKQTATSLSLLPREPSYQQAPVDVVAFGHPVIVPSSFFWDKRQHNFCSFIMLT